MRRLPTSAELPAGAARYVGIALALVLVADLRAVGHLRSDRTPCAAASLPGLTSLEVGLHVTAPVLRAGDDVVGTATIVNRSRTPRVLLRADAVLVTPGSTHPVSWAGSGQFRPVDLRPGTFVSVPFVVHLERCRDDGAALAPGFYEVVLLLVEHHGEAVRTTRSAPQAVVLSPS